MRYYLYYPFLRLFNCLNCHIKYSMFIYLCILHSALSKLQQWWWVVRAHSTSSEKKRA